MKNIRIKLFSRKINFWAAATSYAELGEDDVNSWIEHNKDVEIAGVQHFVANNWMGGSLFITCIHYILNDSGA